jgi:hypothetical protein
MELLLNKKKIMKQFSVKYRFSEEHCFLKLPKLHLFAYPVTLLCRCRKLWRIGGMILTGDEQMYKDKGCPNVSGFYLTKSR